MALISQNQLSVPYKDMVSNKDGLLTRTWEMFFRLMQERLEPLGYEQNFEISNNVTNQSLGLKFSPKYTSQVIFDFLVQRVTTGGGAVELIESGIFIISYKPTSENWSLHVASTTGPHDSGVDFSVSSDQECELRYTSSNVSGTPSISKLFIRARTMSGKNYQYSSVRR